MVLLIVDTQTMIMNEALYEFQLLESRIKTLIAQARRHGVEVVYVRHDDGAENALTKGAQGFDIYDEDVYKRQALPCPVRSIISSREEAAS